MKRGNLAAVGMMVVIAGALILLTDGATAWDGGCLDAMGCWSRDCLAERAATEWLTSIGGAGSSLNVLA